MRKQRSDYNVELSSQLQNSKRPPIFCYYSWLYNFIEVAFENESNVLEIGAGAGISSNFLSNQNILRTDYLEWNSDLVIGKIDATQLPYKDGEFSGAFAVDALHHIPDPVKAVLELLRVTTKGGTVILIEPYVSWLSFPVYKLFHTEKTSWKMNINPNEKVLSNNADDGDQGIAQAVFTNDSILNVLRERSGFDLSISIRYITPIAFFATGGLGRPLPTPVALIRSLIWMESKIPQPVMKYLASRIVIKILMSGINLPG